MSKPFFFRIDAAEFMSEVFQILDGEHKQWVSQFAIDLVSGKGSTTFSQRIIDESINYIEKKKKAGSKGGKTRVSNAQANSSDAQALLGSAQANSSDAQASSSSSNSKEESKDKNKVKRFVIPSVEEITAYCNERSNNVDPQKFFDHYEARGWIPKGYKSQMKDWKAAIRTWEPTFTPSLRLVPPKELTSEERHAALQKRLAL